MKWFLVYWVLVVGPSGEAQLHEVGRTEFHSLEQCRAERALSKWMQEGADRGIGCLREDFDAAQIEGRVSY